MVREGGSQGEGSRNAGPRAGPPPVPALPQCCPVLRSKWSLKRNSTTSMTQRAWVSPSRPGKGVIEGLGEGPDEGLGERQGEGPVRGWVRGQVKDQVMGLVGDRVCVR